MRLPRWSRASVMARKPPTFHRIAAKMKKATATQVSASKNIAPSLSRHGAVERRLDRGALRRLAGEPGDDRHRSLGGDAAHARHRRGGAARDRRFGRGDPGVELGLERLALDVGLGGERVARLLRDRLRLGTRLGERLLIGGARGLRLGPQAIPNHRSCDAKVSLANGGKAPLACAAGAAPVVAWVGWAKARLRALALDDEEQEQRDEQREDAERLGHREAEDQPRELAVGGRRVAQRAREVVREDEADADAGAAHSEAGETGADELRSGGIHVESSLKG